MSITIGAVGWLEVTLELFVMAGFVGWLWVALDLSTVSADVLVENRELKEPTGVVRRMGAVLEVAIPP